MRYDDLTDAEVGKDSPDGYDTQIKTLELFSDLLESWAIWPCLVDVVTTILDCAISGVTSKPYLRAVL